MSDVNPNQFEQRFQTVVRHMRLTRVLTVLGWAAVVLAAVVIVLACADYFLEADWGLRAAIVGIATATATLGAAFFVLRALQCWNRRSTAAQVERRFEDLGQSVRTAVQFRDEEATGVSPTLLEALHNDVDTKTEELRLTEAVSTGPLKISMVCLGLLGLITLIASFTSWDWRVALSRALLGNRPYTTVNVNEGDVLIDEKATFQLNANVMGRIAGRTQLRTRLLDEEGELWDTRSLTASDATSKETRLVSYQVDIPKVKKPFEYQVVSGKYASPVHRVDVRYPLAIQSFHIELTSPEYTGIETKQITKGSFDAVEGSQATIGITLDHAPDKAWLELRPIFTPRGDEPTIERIELGIHGSQLSTRLDLQEDRFYEVRAETNDGTKIRPNRFRIRVHEDRPPRIAFETPAQLTEVHPLAELLMKLKVADDYGLRRAGIVFQRNNEDEYPLEDIPYKDIALEDGRMTPQTKAIIESMFPLEYFSLTVNDSISYYGFAEDNRPGTANRNETEMHFIDVRPFRREYAQPQNNGLDGMGNNDNNPNRRNLPDLNDMINRERFVLNRTMQMQRRNDRGKPIDAIAIDNLIRTQDEGSDLTFQMAQVAEEIELEFGIPDEGRISDLLAAARGSMMDASDALSNSEFEVAKLQEKDALQHLINARQRLDEPIQEARNGRGARARAAIRRAFANIARRRQQRPRTDQQRARMIVQRLRQAAAQQEFLMDKMTDLVPPELPEEEDTDQEQEEQRAEDESNDDQQPMQDDQEDGQLNQEDDQRDDWEDDEQDEEESRRELRRQLEDEQEQLTDEIQDIVEMIEELQQLSDLAGQRTNRAMNGVTGVVGALQRGNTRGAMVNASAASARLRILADNIAGVTADEATKRIEIARDLGLMLSDEIRDLEKDIRRAEQKLDATDEQGDALEQLEDELTQPLSDRAEEQAEVAKTIQDILASITNPETGIQDSEDLMVTRLEAIMNENELETNIGRMQQVSTVVDAMNWSDATVQTNDLADRFEIVSQRLDALHREILSPRLEQLRKLERRTSQAYTGLANLQTTEQVGRWHLRADGLLDDIESAEVAEPQVAATREAMSNAGWGSTNAFDWEPNANQSALEAPTEYGKSLGAVLAEIQRHIRELSLLDSELQNTGRIPPKYKEFVDRYLEVLTGATDQPQEEELE